MADAQNSLKKEIARLQMDLNERKEKMYAMERNLYNTETLEKLDWRKK